MGVELVVSDRSLVVGQGRLARRRVGRAVGNRAFVVRQRTLVGGGGLDLGNGPLVVGDRSVLVGHWAASWSRWGQASLGAGSPEDISTTMVPGFDPLTGGNGFGVPGGMGSRGSGGDSGPDALSVTARRAGSRAVVTLVGALDLHTADELAAALAGALGPGVSRVELDAAGLDFADSAGLRALLAARAEANAAGRSFGVVHARGSLARLIEITGLSELLLAD